MLVWGSMKVGGGLVVRVLKHVSWIRVLVKSISAVRNEVALNDGYGRYGV